MSGTQESIAHIKQVSGRSFIDRPETCSITATGDHGEGRERSSPL
uniref:Uncharacterized protein n=1 Tax=Siphoviridae sp. ctQ091 TaxID=2825490 RepID=A0A8S5NV28_9CAUD|nr:MAG TPA: hypothetical protein [Siphoviridae sp. ctQ091]